MSDYSKTGKPIQGSRGISKEVRDEFSLIETAVNSKANIASPTFTGTPAAPTPTLGDSSTKLATTAFVAGTASSAALPGQLGNEGKFVKTDGTNADWEWAEEIARNSQITNYTAVEGDRGKLINFTGSGYTTLALTAAATLGGGWYCYVKNAGTVTVTIDPDGAETIGGAATLAVYPGQTMVLQCDGSNFISIKIDGVPRITRDDRTSNTQLGLSDHGQYINITSGTFSQTFAPCATLSGGWWCYIHNNGTGSITLDPSGTETIDGLTTFVMYPGELRKVFCDGSALRSVVINAFFRAFASSGTFTTPPGYRVFEGLLWGGGGSGARTTTAGSNSGGGGGGACNPFKLPSSFFGSSVTITIGAGGAAQTTANTNGNAGGNSTLGSLLTGFGGGPGATSTAVGAGGGGGGLTSAGLVSGVGGEPGNEVTTASNRRVFGGGHGNTSANSGPSTFGGGSGGAASDTLTAQGGSSVYGGGGGGGVTGDTSTASAGGTSIFGGNGGAGGLDANGTAGTQPGGGGGGTHNGAQSGAGGDGQLTIWGII